jgi:secondary thiamine-phosphate synthase enzyme
MTKPALLKVRSSRRVEILDITGGIAAAIADSGVKEGICVLQSLHTTAALTINESADPDVRRDMESQLALIAPRDPAFRHAEGNSDAHIKTSLFGPSLTLVISGGRLVLGTWQAVYFCEFDGPRERSVVIKCVEG